MIMVRNMNRVGINFEGVDPPPWRGRIAPFIDRVLKELGRDNWDLSLLFCDNSYIRGLNAAYRRVDEATDVLSFGQGEGFPFNPRSAPRLSGDIVISLDALEENVRYFAVSADEELRRLLIHGILHLDGMDHHDNDPREPMLQKQETLLAGLSENHIVQES
jgi:probable rRNA maturation factor